MKSFIYTGIYNFLLNTNTKIIEKILIRGFIWREKKDDGYCVLFIKGLFIKLDYNLLFSFINKDKTLQNQIDKVFIIL